MADTENIANLISPENLPPADIVLCFETYQVIIWKADRSNKQVRRNWPGYSAALTQRRLGSSGG